MAKRKTIEVSKILEIVNKASARKGIPDLSPEQYVHRREGMQMVLEAVLHETNNYKGFRYLTNEELPEGCLPGVRYEHGKLLGYPQRFDKVDDTRRMYYG